MGHGQHITLGSYHAGLTLLWCVLRPIAWGGAPPWLNWNCSIYTSIIDISYVNKYKIK